MLNILYIGPNESKWAEANCPGSIAAAKWSRGFLSGLVSVARVTALTHTYYFPWPKGDKIWSSYDKRLYPDGWDCEVVSYPVFRYVRELWWKFAYARKAKQIIKDKKVDVVIMYNCYEKWQVSVLRSIRRSCPLVKICPIILDGQDPRVDDWKWIRAAAKYSDAFVVLSQWMYENLPNAVGRPAYHLDGGAERWHGDDSVESAKASGQKRIVVYTGELSKWSGVDFLSDVVAKVNSKDVEFVICGRVISEDVSKLRRDNRVSFAGYLSDEQLHSLCCKASAFLNVRNPSVGDNVLNFPSKLPRYLSYGKPVVSNALLSLSKEYDDYLFVANDNSVDGYVAQLDRALALKNFDKVELRNRIKNWLVKEKLWSAQSRKFAAWMANSLIGGHDA